MCSGGSREELICRTIAQPLPLCGPNQLTIPSNVLCRGTPHRLQTANSRLFVISLSIYHPSVVYCANQKTARERDKHMSEKQFSGKAVVITGATSGIGKACAIAFAEGGARVACVGRKESSLADLTKEQPAARDGAGRRRARCRAIRKRRARLVGSVARRVVHVLTAAAHRNCCCQQQRTPNPGTPEPRNPETSVKPVPHKPPAPSPSRNRRVLSLSYFTSWLQSRERTCRSWPSRSAAR